MLYEKIKKSKGQSVVGAVIVNEVVREGPSDMMAISLRLQLGKQTALGVLRRGNLIQGIG